MTVIVQKYGGTSVNTAENRERVLGNIIRAKKLGSDVVVVVSAMGRKGEPYATDTFLELLEQIGPEAAKKTRDLLSSCGEIVTACLVAHALEKKGYPACAMTGFQTGIITDAQFSCAEIKRVDPGVIRKTLKKGVIAVVAGFQGITEDGEITTLGRGGSDTTALALGGALGADLVEIYTDVPGIAFTDPRLLPEAPYLKKIDFHTLYMLARAGAKVMYHRAVKTAMTYNQRFMVRSTFSDDVGTLVGEPGESLGGLYGAALLKEVFIFRFHGCSPLGKWKSIAVDDIFYYNDNNGCCLAIDKTQAETAQKEGHGSLSEVCDILTLMWDIKEGVAAEQIEKILTEKGIVPEAYFPLQNGGAWAFPAQQSRQALRVLYEVFSAKSTK